jgi:hypothetical protein
MFSYFVECYSIWSPNDRENKAGWCIQGSTFVDFNNFLVLQEVEGAYCISNGHSHDAEIIYGDTDSVMVRFGPTDLAKVMDLGMSLHQTLSMYLMGLRFRQRSSQLCHSPIH